MVHICIFYNWIHICMFGSIYLYIVWKYTSVYCMKIHIYIYIVWQYISIYCMEERICIFYGTSSIYLYVVWEYTFIYYLLHICILYGSIIPLLFWVKYYSFLCYMCILFSIICFKILQLICSYLMTHSTHLYWLYTGVVDLNENLRSVSLVGVIAHLWCYL